MASRSTPDETCREAAPPAAFGSLRQRLAILLVAVTPLAHAQQNAATAIDELLSMLGEDSTLEVRKIAELPPDLRGPLTAVAEYDADQGKWMPMDGPQDFGQATINRITVLGHEVGFEGFAKARYLEFTDRRVCSYTGVTQDRRLSISL